MSIKIIKKGIADSQQNAGNYGHQNLGIQVGGYMDFLSAQLANKILGNTLDNTVYEIHFPSSHFEFVEAVFIAITGANFIPVLNEKSIPMHEPIEIKKGDVLQFLKPMQGRITYMAISKNGPKEKVKEALIEQVETLLFKPTPLRFIPGPAWEDLTPSAKESLVSSKFQISLQSNRMGYPLKGPLLPLHKPNQYLSAAVTRGTLQLLPNGDLMVLMADHQTIGGYANLGQIILVDLPRFAQLSNQASIHFMETNIDTAHKLYQQIEKKFIHRS
jgi:antagonist of KipI